MPGQPHVSTRAADNEASPLLAKQPPGPWGSTLACFALVLGSFLCAGFLVTRDHKLVHLKGSTLHLCDELNALEASLSTAGERLGNTWASYTSSLASWRASHPAGEQPSCRTKAIGSNLCKRALDFAQFQEPPPKGGELWAERMRELSSHESMQKDCMHFDDLYHPKKFKPEVFAWYDKAEVPKPAQGGVLADPDYATYWAKAVHLAPPYGAPQVVYATWSGHKVRQERLWHVNSLWVLTKAVPSATLAGVKQIVEFGGGTGDLTAALHDLGYAGTHFVYDLPPMLPMQRYWHQYSGVPSFFGRDLQQSPDGVPKGMGTVLESSLGDGLAHHLDANLARESLFLGWVSFTEAAVESRDKIRKLVSDFGLIQLIFWPSFDGVSNLDYLRDWVQDELKATHNVLAWTGEGVSYFVAARKDFGDVVCSPKIWCSREAVISEIGSPGALFAETEF